MNFSLPHTDHKIPMPHVMPPKPADLSMLIYTQEILLWCSTFRTSFDLFVAEKYLIGDAIKDATEIADIAVDRFRIANAKRDSERPTT